MLEATAPCDLNQNFLGGKKEWMEEIRRCSPRVRFDSCLGQTVYCIRTRDSWP
jgi:hypothetical protein